MHHALFKAHWEGTGRLEDVDDLVRIGMDVGLDGADLKKAIEEDRYAAAIDDNRSQAEAVGINAIPAHVFGRRFLVMGAQPEAAFRQVVERVRRESLSE
jgi:predicted DsbA family dithiol-disulfide isomerase